MPKIKAFGCSLTYGDGLPDCSIMKNGKYLCYGEKPSRYAWPSVVAKGLSVDCENYAQPGSSNKQITLEIMNQSYTDTDIILINWSFIERYCIVNRKSEYMQIAPNFKNNYSSQFTKFHLRFGSHYNQMTDSLIQIKAADSHLKKFTDNIYHYLTDENQYLDLPEWFDVDVKGYSLETLYSRSTGLDGSHPDIDGHAEFAKKVIKNIKENAND